MQAASRHHGLIRRLSLLSVLLIALLSTAAFILTHSRVHDLLIQHLKTKLGIEASTLRVQLLPQVSIDVSDLLVRDALHSEPILRAAKASLSIRLWPLITKRVLRVTLDAAEPQVVIRRDRDGCWHLPLIDVNRTDAPSDTSSDAWLVTDLNLTDGKLRIFDENRLESEGIGVHHVQTVFRSNPTNTRADLMFSGTTDDGGDLHIAGSLLVERFDSSNGSRSKQFDGTLRFQNWDLAYWLERTGQFSAIRSGTTDSRGHLSAVLHLDFPTGTEGFSAIVSDITTDMGWLALGGQIVVKDAGTDHPAYAMALSTSPVSSQALFTHIPTSWIPQPIHAAVRENRLTGTIELESIALRGKIDVLRVPDEWEVVARLVDGNGRWGNKPVFIRNVSGTVSLDSRSAEVTHFAADVNGVHLRSAKLTLSDLDVIPTLDAHLNVEGQVDNVMSVLEGFSQDTEAHTSVRTISNATGNLHVAVRLAGPIMPQPSLRLISAEMSLQDVGARFGRTLSITHLNGTFAANSHFIGIKHVEGLLQGIHFEAEGNIDIESTPRVNNLKVEMSSDGDVIQELLTAYLPSTPLFRIAGPVHSALLLSGTPEGVHCHGMVDVTRTHLSMPAVIDKRPGVPGIIEWDGTLFDGKRVIFDQLRLALRNSELRAAGQVELDHTPKFQLHINAGPLSLQTLAESGVNTPITEGIMHTSASISGEGTNWRSWMPSGSASIDRGVIPLQDLSGVEDLRQLSGRLRFTSRGVLLDEVSFRMADDDVKLTGMIEQWRSHPRATLMVESSQLNLSNVVAKTSHTDTSRSNVQEWGQSTEAAITFLVKQLRYDRLVLKTVSGEIRVNQHTIKLNNLRGETPKGVFSGRLEAQFGAHDRIDIAAQMSADGIPAQHVLPATNEQKERVQGDVSIDGVLRARVDPHLPLKDTMSTGGDGLVVKITNGRLHEDPVLTKALKILNLPAVLFGPVDFDQEGIPFDVFSARVTAQNGVFSSEDIVLDSPVIKVAGAGSADLSDNGLDLALAVSPVASYSDFFARIPFLGPLFVGDHSGLTTAVFQAKGSLRSPDVSYLPFLSFAKGLTGYPRLAIDVLTHTIKLPQTALAVDP